MKELSWFENNEKQIPTGEVRTRFAPSPTGYMQHPVLHFLSLLSQWILIQRFYMVKPFI